MQEKKACSQNAKLNYTLAHTHSFVFFTKAFINSQ